MANPPCASRPRASEGSTPVSVGTSSATGSDPPISPCASAHEREASWKRPGAINAIPPRPLSRELQMTGGGHTMNKRLLISVAPLLAIAALAAMASTAQADWIYVANNDYPEERTDLGRERYLRHRGGNRSATRLQRGRSWQPSFADRTESRRLRISLRFREIPVRGVARTIGTAVRRRTSPLGRSGIQWGGTVEKPAFAHFKLNHVITRIQWRTTVQSSATQWRW